MGKSRRVGPGRKASLLVEAGRGGNASFLVCFAPFWLRGPRDRAQLGPGVQGPCYSMGNEGPREGKDAGSSPARPTGRKLMLAL